MGAPSPMFDFHPDVDLAIRALLRRSRRGAGKKDAWGGFSSKIHIYYLRNKSYCRLRTTAAPPSAGVSGAVFASGIYR